VKTIIQVPIEKELVIRLDELAARRGVSRAAVIRTACARYLSQLENDEREQRYIEGYRRIPDGTTEEETFAWLAAADLPAEDWPEAPRRES
jgi:metal-responsive CopG/Arc/MetJ family transcriptional regulator